MGTETAKIEKAYVFESLASYSFKDRLVIKAADLAFYILIKTIGCTIRFETENQDAYQGLLKQNRLPIYSFWHNDIFLGTYFFRNRKIVVMTSQSKDGEYIARFIVRLGFGAARGSSTRGGIGGLVEMIRLMKKGSPAGFAVDGPKGPRHIVKPGAVLLAKKTGNPILPFVLVPQKYWTIKSWDKLVIPKPFTRSVVIFGEPIEVDASADENELAEKTSELQSSLDALVERGNEWRKDS